MAAMITIHRSVSTGLPSEILVRQHSLPSFWVNAFAVTFVPVRRLSEPQRRRLRVPNTDRPSAPPSEEPSDRMNEVTIGLFSTSPMPPPSLFDGWPGDCPLGALGA